MSNYILKHLTQPENQQVIGPIQDDEALLLYALIRCCRLSNILEVGGLNGYSANNFLEATKDTKNSIVVSIDINPIVKLQDRHLTVVKSASEVTMQDLNSIVFDLVFFDCHNYEAQLKLFTMLNNNDLLSPTAFLVLHDTNLHPSKITTDSIQHKDGWIHQIAERHLANELHKFGYQVVNFHTSMKVHSTILPFRHGLTICQKYKELKC